MPGQIIPLTDAEIMAVMDDPKSVSKFTSDERRRMIGIHERSAQAPTDADSAFAGITGEAVTGAVKSGLEHLSNISQMVGGPRIPVNTRASNPSQAGGKTMESIAEYAVPLGGEEKAAGLAARVGAGRAGQVIARMGGGATEMAAKTAVQGGDSSAITRNAALGAAGPVLGAAASGARNAVTERLPEKMYGQIFKADPADFRAKYESIASGKPVNPTLAREVLDRGIAGTSQDMAVQSIQDLNGLEKKLQVAAADKMVTLPQKGAYVSLLKEFKGQFAKTIFSDRADEADRLIKLLQSHRGDATSATDALQVKRFLDSMRNTSSFRDNPALSPRQEEYKIAADKVRGVLHADPKLSELLNEERVRIQALDDIVTDAVSRSNKKLLGLTDVLLGGGGLASGTTLGGITAAGAARGFQQPFTLTTTGRALNRAGQMVPADAERAATRSAIGAAANRSSAGTSR